MVESKTSLPLKTPREVLQHCSPKDCWVSIHGKVLDVTKLVQVLIFRNSVALDATQDIGV